MARMWCVKQDRRPT